ncbi:MAG: aconitase X catalytic domain-containing protein [Xanthomonadales bacterium]|nr:aconitase X catalytic domain-containing protein [Xanthomonadales bacterium]
MHLDRFDQECLGGRHGEAARFAMTMLLRVGEITGADRLIDVSRCHLVGAYDGGGADRRFLERLRSMDARVRVPTTLNASSACLDRLPGMDEAARDRASWVVDAYVALGCRPTLTCAPYLLADAPVPGECIAWAESNAVVFANSVLGARTNATVQYLDLCAALTGRIPRQGLYRSRERVGTVVVDASVLRLGAWRRESGFALLGLWLGSRLDSGSGDAVIPVLTGLPESTGADELRTLGAAMASAGNLAMFHAVGLTPEAPDEKTATAGKLVPRVIVTSEALEAIGARYSASPGTTIEAVCLGTPHYSPRELKALAAMLRRHGRPLRCPMVVTTARDVVADPDMQDCFEGLRSFGITLISDTCSYYGSVVPGLSGTVMTDSAKWAWYAAGNLGVRPVLAGLDRCVASAVEGRVVDLPDRGEIEA